VLQNAVNCFKPSLDGRANPDGGCKRKFGLRSLNYVANGDNKKNSLEREFFLFNLYNKISSKDVNEIEKIVVSGVARKIKRSLGSSGADFSCIALYYILFI
jgi:hypothetical protein